MWSAARGKAVVAGTTGKGAGVGWGRAEHPQPRPEPSDLTSKERGREVQQKRDTGEDATGRGATVAPSRGWRCRGCLSHPTPTLHAAPHLLARPLIPYHRKGHWAQPPAQGVPPSKRLSLPTFLSRADTVGGEAQEPGG